MLCFSTLKLVADIMHSYVLRIPANYDRAKGPEPIVFLHGLGLGIWQHQNFIKRLLLELPDTPFLMILTPQTSQDFFHPFFLKPIKSTEIVSSITEVLQSLGWTGTKGEKRGVTLLSHSK